MQTPMVEELCDECGRWFLRKSGRAKHRCQSCRLRRQVENAEAMHTKSGPYYEAWKRAMSAATERL